MKPTCTICKLRVTPGQGIYSITGNHYDCEKPRVDKIEAEWNGLSQEQLTARIDSAFKSMDDSMNKLCDTFGVKRRKTRVPDGQGPTAKKVQEILKAALEKKGHKVVKIVMWNQAPQYRGPKWDLAAWGAFVEVVSPFDSKKTLPYTVASWATWTQCAKKGIRLVADGSFSYDVEHL